MGSTILLVDDSKPSDSRRTIVQHAEDDYQVVDKEDDLSIEVVVIRRKALPDLVILDRNMYEWGWLHQGPEKDSGLVFAQVEMTELVKGLAELEAEVIT